MSDNLEFKSVLHKLTNWASLWISATRALILQITKVFGGKKRPQDRLSWINLHSWVHIVLYELPALPSPINWNSLSCASCPGKQVMGFLQLLEMASSQDLVFSPHAGTDLDWERSSPIFSKRLPSRIQMYSWVHLTGITPKLSFFFLWPWNAFFPHGHEQPPLRELPVAQPISLWHKPLRASVVLL